MTRQKAPSAIRCIKTQRLSPLQRAVRMVRKHRAPKGALRHVTNLLLEALEFLSQKAPSAKRCIKTRHFRAGHPSLSLVRKLRAPQISHVIPFFQLCTNSQKSQNFNDPTSNVETTGRELRATFLRNHPRPAPNGALRQIIEPRLSAHVAGQKAPSAIRCIKTRSCGRGSGRGGWSESTEHQTVH